MTVFEDKDFKRVIQANKKSQRKTCQHMAAHPCNRNDPEDGGKESLEFKESLGCRWRRRLTKKQIRTQQEASHLQIKARPQKKATLPIPSLQSYQRTICCFSHHSIVGVFFWKPELLWYLLLSFKVSPYNRILLEKKMFKPYDNLIYKKHIFSDIVRNHVCDVHCTIYLIRHDC